MVPVGPGDAVLQGRPVVRPGVDALLLPGIDRGGAGVLAACQDTAGGGAGVFQEAADHEAVVGRRRRVGEHIHQLPEVALPEVKGQLGEAGLCGLAEGLRRHEEAALPPLRPRPLDFSEAAPGLVKGRKNCW